MPHPPLAELDQLKDIVARCAGLSQRSLQWLRAELLALRNAVTPTDRGDADPHVAEAQEKTAKLFARRADGE